MKDRRPIKLEVTLTVSDTIRQLKNLVLTQMSNEAYSDADTEQVIAAEVANHIIFRILVSCVCCSLYARTLFDDRVSIIFIALL